MKPSRRARVAAAITLSKGKMYEYGVPLEDHLELPADLNLEQQFPLAIGTLGDFAAEAVMKAIRLPLPEHTTPREEVIFAAQVLQAFDDSLLNEELSFELRLLAAAAFYLGDVPGSAAVLMKRLALLEHPAHDPLAIAVRVALDRPWVRVGVPDSSRSALNSSGNAPISLRRSSTSDLTNPARMALFRSKSVTMCGKNTLRLFLPEPTSL